MYINDKIICQRFFNIRDYNENVIHSYELKELVDRITGTNIDVIGSMGIIPNHLKNKSVDFLWNNFNPYMTKDETNKGTDKIDNFQFEIKVDKISVAKSHFSGNLFPPKVRYSVDIKEVIPNIITEIRHFFSLKNYKKVQNFSLN